MRELIDSFNGEYYSGTLKHDDKDGYYYVNYRMCDYGYKSLLKAKEKFEELKEDNIRFDRIMKGEYNV